VYWFDYSTFFLLEGQGRRAEGRQFIESPEFSYHISPPHCHMKLARNLAKCFCWYSWHFHLEACVAELISKSEYILVPDWQSCRSNCWGVHFSLSRRKPLGNSYVLRDRMSYFRMKMQRMHGPQTRYQMFVINVRVQNANKRVCSWDTLLEMACAFDSNRCQQWLILECCRTFDWTFSYFGDPHRFSTAV